MDILTLAFCTMFLVLTIHAYCMPIKKSVEHIEKDCCRLPFSDEDVARTL